ncbi:phosphotransferase enzyme family protein [Pseudooceanicola atlanticus]|uniref:phosphotransferase enzyme family protein n=1 Tax=Pseudooceanicola atlanticus TaxID=1461694 RepID=UPI000AA29597|nr:phosphotransferase [Pseudooceanicola atlanticus]
MLYQEDFIERLQAGLNTLLPYWNLSKKTDLKLLTVSENATFIARDPDRENPVILRVHRPNYHKPTEIESELAWISALRLSGAVDTPALIATREGSYLTSFEDGADTRHVVAFEFMTGEEPDADAALVPGFALLGEISARLHRHVEGWDKPEGFTRKTWDFDSAFGPEPLWGDWRAALGLTAEGQAVLDKALTKLEDRLTAYGKGADRFGLIHADLRLANLLKDGDHLGVIDFDDCGYSWFIYDFAAAISFHELNPIVPDLQAAWLEGYQKVRPLSAEDIGMIPDFIFFRRLLLTAWIASHSETETAQEAGMADYTEGTIALARTYLESGA